MLSDEEIADILKRNDNVDKIAVSLVDAAIDAGGKDNTSVVVLRV
jgi:serine/threonine protein phosphatase PrpC